jgi:hypothetical protein
LGISAINAISATGVGAGKTKKKREIYKKVFL